MNALWRLGQLQESEAGLRDELLKVGGEGGRGGGRMKMIRCHILTTVVADPRVFGVHKEETGCREVGHTETTFFIIHLLGGVGLQQRLHVRCQRQRSKVFMGGRMRGARLQLQWSVGMRVTQVIESFVFAGRVPGPSPFRYACSFPTTRPQ